MIAIILIVIGIGGLIFVHELGHFLVAKWSGVKVEVFSIGFGWKFLKTEIGETEYALSAIPLGGYVKMAGELPNEERTGADHELHAQPAWKRFWIFSAGSLMNLIVAFPLCILMYWIGVEVPENTIGLVRDGSPEWEAGIEAGSKLVGLQLQKRSAENTDQSGVEWGPKQEIDSLGTYREHLISLGKNQKIKLLVAPPGSTSDDTVREFVITPEDPISSNMGQALVPFGNVIRQVVPDSPADRAGLQTGDRIVSVRGYPVRTTLDIQNVIEKAVDPSLTCLVQKKNGELDVRELSVPPGTPYLMRMDDRNVPLYYPGDGLSLPDDLPLNDGEQLLRINGHPVASNASSGPYDPTNLAETRLFRTPSPPVQIKVRRDGSTKTLSLYPDIQSQPKPRLNLLVKPEIKYVRKDSPAARAGLTSGDEIESINGRPVPRFAHMLTWIRNSPDRELTIDVRRPQTRTFQAPAGEIDTGRRAVGGAVFGEKGTVVQRVRDDSAAAASGVRTGDRIYSINGNRRRAIPNLEKLKNRLESVGFLTWVSDLLFQNRKAPTIRVTTAQYDTKTLSVTPEKNEYGDGSIGVMIENNQPVYPLPDLPDDSGLARSGFQKGDRLRSFFTLSGERNELKHSIRPLQNYFRKMNPEKLDLVFDRRRNGETTTMKRTYTPDRRPTGRIGVRLGPATFSKQYRFQRGITKGVQRAADMYVLTVVGIKRMFSSAETARRNLAGPVRIFSMSYRTAQRDLGQFLLILAMITISLGILNLLPLPPLDGGHILFLAIEKLKGGPLSEDTLYLVQMMGFLFLLIFIILVTYNDILNLVTG